MIIEACEVLWFQSKELHAEKPDETCMERSFLAAQSSGDDRSWLPLPSTVELRGFPRTGSRASSSVAQLNSDSLGIRGWFELCPAMGRGEAQPGEESSQLLPPPPEARGEQGWQLVLLGSRHHSSLRSAAEAIVPYPLMNVSITQQQELPAWLSRCRTYPQECVRMRPLSPCVLTSHLPTSSRGACRADDCIFS